MLLVSCERTGLTLPSAWRKKLFREWSLRWIWGVVPHSNDVSTAVAESWEEEEKTSEESSSLGAIPTLADGWSLEDSRGIV